MKLTLGKKYRDMVTGFEGIAMSRTEYLWSCERVLLQPTELHEQKLIPCEVFDLHQLVEIGEGLLPLPSPEKDNRPGGPGDIPAPRSVAVR